MNFANTFTTQEESKLSEDNTQMLSIGSTKLLVNLLTEQRDSDFNAKELLSLWNFCSEMFQIEKFSLTH